MHVSYCQNSDRVHLKAFGISTREISAGPQKHAEFTSLPFWRSDYRSTSIRLTNPSGRRRRNLRSKSSARLRAEPYGAGVFCGMTYPSPTGRFSGPKNTDQTERRVKGVAQKWLRMTLRTRHQVLRFTLHAISNKRFTPGANDGSRTHDLPITNRLLYL